MSAARDLANVAPLMAASGSNVVFDSAILVNGTSTPSTLSRMDIQEFTSSGTWTKPAGSSVVVVECWGAGAGGGSGGLGVGSIIGGYGGGGGAYVTRTFNAASLPSTVLVTVGAGGTGAAARTTDGSSVSGTDGGDSSFGNYLIAYGAGGGRPGGVLSSGANGAFPSSTISGLSQGIIAGAFGAASYGSGSISFQPGSGWSGGQPGGNGSTTSNSPRLFGGSSFQGGAGGGGGGHIDASFNSSVGATGGGTSGNNGTGGAGGTLVSPNGSNGVQERNGGGGGASLYATVNDRGIYYAATDGTRILSLTRGNILGGDTSLNGVWGFTTSGGAAGQINPTDIPGANFSTSIGNLLYDGTKWVFLTRGVDNITSYIYSSTNRTNWTLRYSEVANFTSIAHSAGTYVIVGDSGTIKTSNDLINWTARTSGTANTLNQVIHDGVRWIAVGATATVITSTNTTTWTNISASLASQTSASLVSVASNQSTIHVIPSTGNFAYRTQDLGSTWNGSSNAMASAMNGRVSFANSIFVVASASSAIWTTVQDSFTWTQQADNTTNAYGIPVFMNGFGWFVGINTPQSNQQSYVYSPDAVTWTVGSITTFYNANGGNGGNGAAPGGGGGGGGAARSSLTSGAGGNGARGLVRICAI